MAYYTGSIWGVILNAGGEPINWGEIIGIVGEDFFLFESFGQYPKSLVRKFNSPSDAMREFEKISDSKRA
ncbi:MAG: hypothetical protein WC682_00300 [Parcubacteria group bacterium]|jgi:hypothetical protein